MSSTKALSVVFSTLKKRPLCTAIYGSQHLHMCALLNSYSNRPSHLQCPTYAAKYTARGFSSTVTCCSEKKWKVGKINHLAVVTPDLLKSTKFYKDVLGAKVSEEEALPEHGVKVVFVELGDTKLELLYPIGENSPVQAFAEKNKSGGMHHICIEVDDIEAAMRDIKENNIRLLSETSKIGAHGKPVVFLHPKDCNGVLVELEQA